MVRVKKDNSEVEIDEISSKLSKVILQIELSTYIWSTRKKQDQ